jgi:hypothetical protein
MKAKQKAGRAKAPHASEAKAAPEAQKARQASHQARGGAIGARTGQGAIDAEKAAAAAFLAPLPEDYLDSDAASPDYSRIILRQGNRLIGALWDFGTTFNLAPWKAAATAIREILSRLAWPSLKPSPELEALGATRFLQAWLENPSLKPSPELEARLWKESHIQPHVWAALQPGGNKELAQEIAAMPEAPKKLETQRQKRAEGAKDKNKKQGAATRAEVVKRLAEYRGAESGKAGAIEKGMRAAWNKLQKNLREGKTDARPVDWRPVGAPRVRQIERESRKAEIR